MVTATMARPGNFGVQRRCHPERSEGPPSSNGWSPGASFCHTRWLLLDREGGPTLPAARCSERMIKYLAAPILSADIEHPAEAVELGLVDPLRVMQQRGAGDRNDRLDGGVDRGGPARTQIGVGSKRNALILATSEAVRSGRHSGTDLCKRFSLKMFPS
jgi:hypothetical protein